MHIYVSTPRKQREPSARAPSTHAQSAINCAHCDPQHHQHTYLCPAALTGCEAHPPHPPSTQGACLPPVRGSTPAGTGPACSPQQSSCQSSQASRVCCRGVGSNPHGCCCYRKGHGHNCHGCGCCCRLNRGNNACHDFRHPQTHNNCRDHCCPQNQCDNQPLAPCCCQGCCGWLSSEPCGPKTCCQKHRCMTQTDRQHTQVQVSDRAELHPKLAVCLFVRAAYAVVTFDACRCEREQPGQQVLLLQAHAHMHTCTEAHTHYRQGPLLAATCLRQVGVSPLQVEILSHGPLGRLKDKKGQKKLNKTGVVFVLRHTHPAPALNPITAAAHNSSQLLNPETPFSPSPIGLHSLFLPHHHTQPNSPAHSACSQKSILWADALSSALLCHVTGTSSWPVADTRNRVRA
jgi:hypothetical protein